jgi:S1-C subfamily serine protease
VRSVVGTAFAIGADGMLATNAHVANALKMRGALTASGSAHAVAVLGDAYSARPIAAALTHPDWKEGSIRGDIAILRLAPGPMLTPLRLADARTMSALRRGTSLAAFGFPAVSTDPEKPRGRLSVDVLGDIRGSYFEVGLGIAPGTSGSPVFNEAGAVVGIVAGGDFTDAPGGVKPTGSAANWALSIATLDEILDRK